MNIQEQKYKYDLKGQLTAVYEKETRKNALTTNSKESPLVVKPFMVIPAAAGEPLLAVDSEDWKLVEQYEYDPAGNILQKVVDGKTTTFTYDKANQIKTALFPDGSVKSFAYDGAGRIVNDSNKSFTYGWSDKVISVTENGDISNFKYYPDGQLASRSGFPCLAGVSLRHVTLQATLYSVASGHLGLYQKVPSVGSPRRISV